MPHIYLEGQINMKDKNIINIRLLTDWSKCNYKCSYCIVAESQDSFVSWSEENFCKIIDNLMKAKFIYNIRLGVQGEFFANKVLIDGGRKLTTSDKCVGVNLITNLSLSIAQFDRAFKGYDLAKVGLVASYHPTEIQDIDSWVKTAIYMNENVDFSVVVVAYPPIISELEIMVSRLGELGIHVALQSFIGEYDGKIYPEAYTSFERERLKKMIYSRHDFEFFVNLKTPEMCYAGSQSFFVNTVNGNVLTCGIRSMKDSKLIGNLIDSADIGFLENPMQCTSPRCLCDTENINTVVFSKYYKNTGVNQHKFEYIGAGDEWTADYN